MVGYSGGKRIHDPSLSQSLPRFDCFWGTLTLSTPNALGPLHVYQHLLASADIFAS